MHPVVPSSLHDRDPHGIAFREEIRVERVETFGGFSCVGDRIFKGQEDGGELLDAVNSFQVHDVDFEFEGGMPTAFRTLCRIELFPQGTSKGRGGVRAALRAAPVALPAHFTIERWRRSLRHPDYVLAASDRRVGFWNPEV